MTRAREVFPWRRAEGVCELCGQPAELLAWVEIESGAETRVVDNRTGHATRRGYRLPRTILVCDRHPGGITNGSPPAVPRKTAMRRPPEQLALFDSAPYLERWRT
jgi:hypothetical protein